MEIAAAPLLVTIIHAVNDCHSRNERNNTAAARGCVALRMARRGGFPTPALHLRTDRERAIWFGGFIRTYLERDLQDLSSITALPDFRRLMWAACHRLGQMLNQTELGRDYPTPPDCGRFGPNTARQRGRG